MASDDEIMAEAESLAAAVDAETGMLKKDCEELETSIEELTARLTRLKVTKATKRLEYDATLVALALSDSEAFLTKILDAGSNLLMRMKTEHRVLRERSLDQFIRQMDNGPTRTYFIATEGNTHPNLGFSMSSDGKILRIQRSVGLKPEERRGDWEILLGSAASLENYACARASPSTTWVADLTDWAEIIGTSPNAPAPAFPMLPDPLETPEPEPAIAPAVPVPVAELRPAKRLPVEKIDNRLPKVLKLIKGTQVPSASSRVPRPGNAFFDYTDSFSTRERKTLRPDMFKGKRTILLIGTSCIAHWRIAAEGFGCFVDLHGVIPQDVAYARYDMTHLVKDEPDTVIFQVAVSGWHLVYGPHPRDAAAMYKFIAEEVFDFQDGFRFTYIGLQIATNDVKYCTDQNVPAHLQPKTDLQLIEQMTVEARKFIREFSPEGGTFLVGMGTPKFHHAAEEVTQLRMLRPAMKVEDLHKILHRANFFHERAAADEAAKLRGNRILDFVHSPMPLLSTEAAVRNPKHIGHVQAPWHGIVARNVVNSLRNGVRMFEQDYRCPLLLCIGSPRAFRADLTTTQEGIHPGDAHSHDGNGQCQEGVAVVCSAARSNDQDKGVWYSLVEVSHVGTLAWTVW